MLGPRNFRFLGIEREVDTTGTWDDTSWSRLWAFNLHYFDDLNSHDGQQRTAWHRALIADWIAANPPAAGVGWEPYPLSLRVVNWIKWSLAGNTLSEEAIHSMAVQLRWLRRNLEWHLLGNHLLVNAKALLFGGAYFQGGDIGEWLPDICTMYDRQLREQVLSDGGHYERSPMYHSAILEDLLDVIQLDHVYPSSQFALAKEPRFRKTANDMLQWLRTMTHPDGQIALMNDSAFDIMPDPNELYDYAERLDLIRPGNTTDGAVHLAESGYVRLQRSLAVIICDVGPLGPDYQPGHGHADTLAFEMSLDGRRFVVDTGTSTYEPGPQRLAERGTAAHNTVELDGEDSSETWDSFRVARRARPRDVQLEEQNDSLALAAAHDGYCRLLKRAIHRREWRLTDNELLICDEVRGGYRTAVARFHLSPATRMVTQDGQELLAADMTNEGLARLAPGDVRYRVGRLDVCFSSQGSVDTFVCYDYHPRFGTIEPSVCVRCELIERHARFRFSWRERAKEAN